MDTRTLKERQFDWAVAWQDHGDQDALEALVDSVKELARTIAYRQTWRSDFREDLLAECRLAAVDAAARFDRGRPDGFASLCALMMRDRCRVAMMQFITPATAPPRTPGTAAHRVAILDDYEEGVDGVALQAPEPAPVLDVAALDELIDGAGLSEQQRRVLSRYARGETREAVGVAMGLTRRRIAQIEEAALARVREHARIRGLGLQDLL